MTNATSALNFQMKSLSGGDVDLAQYQGKVVLIVNVASACGYTPQYKGLQELHEKYAAQGLVVLGVPSNDFGQQEPGSEAEIAQFCQANYDVGFEMLSKVKILGDDKAELYRYLTSSETNPDAPGDVKWNFEKFLIGRDGRIVGRYPSSVAPDAPELIEAIEGELAK